MHPILIKKSTSGSLILVLKGPDRPLRVPDRTLGGRDRPLRGADWTLCHADRGLRG